MDDKNKAQQEQDQQTAGTQETQTDANVPESPKQEAAEEQTEGEEQPADQD